MNNASLPSQGRAGEGSLKTLKGRERSIKK
jgi:hypothetical protein